MTLFSGWGPAVWSVVGKLLSSTFPGSVILLCKRVLTLEPVDETVLCSHFHTNEGWEQIHRFFSFIFKSSLGNLDLLLWRSSAKKVILSRDIEAYWSLILVLIQLNLFSAFKSNTLSWLVCWERYSSHEIPGTPISGNSTLLDCCGWLSSIFYAYTMLALLPFQPSLKWCRTQKRCKSKGFFCQFWH